MKRLAFVLAFGAFCIAGGSAGAQPAATTLSADERGIELQGGGEPTKEDSAEEHRAYDKRVGGLVWLEGAPFMSSEALAIFDKIEGMIGSEGKMQTLLTMREAMERAYSEDTDLLGLFSV